MAFFQVTGTVGVSVSSICLTYIWAFIYLSLSTIFTADNNRFFASGILTVVHHINIIIILKYTEHFSAYIDLYYYSPHGGIAVRNKSTHVLIPRWYLLVPNFLVTEKQARQCQHVNFVKRFEVLQLFTRTPKPLQTGVIKFWGPHEDGPGGGPYLTGILGPPSVRQYNIWFRELPGNPAWSTSALLATFNNIFLLAERVCGRLLSHRWDWPWIILVGRGRPTSPVVRVVDGWHAWATWHCW